MRTLALAACLACGTAHADEASLRATYEQLVQTNTAFGDGDCTLAAQRLVARLQTARGPGIAEVFGPPGHPKEGGLIATLPGSDPRAGAILLLGHLDVVEARREDWGRDPFVLVEQNGFYRARGAADMKALDAIWVDLLAERASARPPRRTVKLALTCGEEGQGLNGLRWLIANRPDAVRAAYALNEGGGGRVDAAGRPVALHFQVLEKTYQDYRLTVTNPGGHSALPRPDNAILELAAALARVGAYRFPLNLNDTTRAFLTRGAARAPAPLARAMRAVARDGDSGAAQILARDPQLNATLRTTCVPTRVDAGQANNALPQHAVANVNCRIVPGETIAGTLATLREVARAGVAVDAVEVGDIAARPQALPTDLLRRAEAIAAAMFPGVPVLPTMTVTASDAPALIRFGVPVYGVPGILMEADGGGLHGRDERVRVSSVLKGRAYLAALVRDMAEQP